MRFRCVDSDRQWCRIERDKIEAPKMGSTLSALHALNQLPFNVPRNRSGSGDKISCRRSTCTSHSATATNPSNSCPRAKPTQKIHRYQKLFLIPIPQPTTLDLAPPLIPPIPVQQHLNKSTSNRQNGSRESLVLAPPELRQGLAQLVRKPIPPLLSTPPAIGREGIRGLCIRCMHYWKGARGGILGRDRIARWNWNFFRDGEPTLLDEMRTEC